MDRVKGLLLLVGIALLVFFITKAVYQPDADVNEVSSTVLLERVRPVLKLVTVEGDFNELYTYKNASAAFDWMKLFPVFQKQAIIRVKARASVGYDLEGMKLEFDETSRTVRLLGMNAPRLLSLEHDVDYYNLEEGTFNSFTAADHTRINAQAKELIRGKIATSGLYAAAKDQRDEMLGILRAVIENGGWKFEDKVSPVDGRTRLKG